MKRRMRLEEMACGGTAKQNGHGHVGRPFPASEQFFTRSCARCGGLLVSDWCYDLHNSGAHRVETLRCVQCGYCIDPVILQNKILQHHVMVSGARHSFSERSGKTVLLDEVA